MANKAQAHGLTAEINRKIAKSYDVEREQQCRDWITAVTGEQFTTPLGSDNFHIALKDGQILCKLVNVIKPGSVRKINTSAMVFKQHENIGLFLKAAEAIGVAPISSFQTVDLYEGKNMPQVLNTIFALGSAAQKVYDGPKLGVKVSDKNVREFDQATIDEGKKYSSLLTAGTNKGATQAGMSFGTQRKM